jgi:hypothetical protein
MFGKQRECRGVDDMATLKNHTVNEPGRIAGPWLPLADKDQRLPASANLEPGMIEEQCAHLDYPK